MRFGSPVSLASLKYLVAGTAFLFAAGCDSPGGAPIGSGDLSPPSDFATNNQSDGGPPLDSAPPPDLTQPPVDFAGADLLGVDLAIPPMPDMALPPGDMATGLPDLRLTPMDLSGPVTDLAGSPCNINYNGGSPQAVGWNNEYPGVLTTDFRSVWGSTAKDLYFVGLGATILHTTDGAATFKPEPVPLPGFVAFFDVWGSAAADVYIVGTSSLVLHSTGNGTWTAQGTPGQKTLSGLWGSSATDVYTVGAAGAIYHSTGNGMWVAQTSNTANGLNRIWGSSPTDIYAVGGAGTVLHSPGGGAWSVQTTLKDSAMMPFTVFSIWGSSATDVYAGGFSPTDGAVFYHSTGNGMWTPIPITSNGGIVALGGTGPNDVYAASAVGEIFHWNGNAWAMQTTGAMSAIRGIFVPPGNTPIYLTGSFAYIASGPVNNTWTVLSNAYKYTDLHGSTAPDATHIYAAGYGGAILVSNATGKGSWNPQISGTTEDLWGAWSSGPADIYVVGTTGTILHSTGNGMWAPQTSGSQLTLTSIWGSSATDVYVVGAMGAILHSTGNGMWAPQVSGVTSDLYRIFGTSAQNLYAVGGGNGKSVILHSTGNGMWTQQTSPVTNQLLGVGGPAANDLYAVGSSGTILRSSGDGCWLKVPAPTTDTYWSVTVRGSDVFIGGQGGALLHGTGGPFTFEQSGTILGLFTSVTQGSSVWMLGQRSYVVRTGP